MKKIQILFIVVIAAICSCSGNQMHLKDDNNSDTITNSKEVPDVEQFKSVNIGNQEWMVENLDVNVFRNGDPIPEAKSDSEWKEASENGQPAWCYYLNDQNNRENHGKLYNWYAVNDPRGLAPEGWCVPSDQDWLKLIEFLGGKTEAASMLKSTIGWNKDGNGTNKSGFNSLPSGYRTPLGVFDSFSVYAYFWTSTESKDNNSQALDVCLYYLVYADIMVEEAKKGFGYSLRCIKE